jgi:hypothetical protein
VQLNKTTVISFVVGRMVPKVVVDVDTQYNYLSNFACYLDNYLLGQLFV